MSELDGPQKKALRFGLLSAFVGRGALDVFLQEELDKRLNFYASGDDSFSIAAFKVIEGAQAEGWIHELVAKAYEARRTNRNIADIARRLGIAVDTNQLESADHVAEVRPPLWRSLNPYRGLLALHEQDANFLFGRDEDIARFVAVLAENPSRLFLALGASGVGKSSLIFAGVFAALNRQSLRGGKPWPEQLSQSRSWPRLTLTPGPEPLRSLAGAFVRQWLDPLKAEFRNETNTWRKLLLEGDGLEGLIDALDSFHLKEKGDRPPRHLLYIDQGEELYTRSGREPNQDNTKKETQAQREARRFSELVAEAARHPRLVAIMSARSDFLGRLQADAPLHAMKQQIDIVPLAPGGISEVVRRPAAALDVAFQRGLDEALVEATRDQAGALPLLSDTLDILWKEMQERGDGILHWTRPLKEGVDVALKLGDRADGFVKAHKEQEALLRRLFCVRLAYVPLQGAATRRMAFLEELTEPERTLVAELAGPDQRIVVTGERDGKATVEVSHEALFTAWQSLRNWIASRRAFFAWVTQVEADRHDYDRQGKPPTALLTGRPLERAKSFLATDGEDIPDKDRAFIEASIKADEEDREREKEKEKKIQEVEMVNQSLNIELENLRELRKNLPSEVEPVDVITSPVEIIDTVNTPQEYADVPANWGLRAVQADISPFDGRGCVVAILDTGIDAEHPAFRGMRLIQKDFTGTGNGDKNGHGTFVASVIAGRDCQESRFGVARGVTELIVAKVLDDSGQATTDGILQALQWIRAYEGGRVDVISVTMGIDYASIVKHRVSAGEDEVVAISNVLRENLQLLRVYEQISVAATLIGKGAVIVSPTGNESREMARAATTSPLAVAKGVLSVGAIKETSAGYEVASFSNSYPSLCAPGVSIQGVSLRGGMTDWDGTSPACANAAGVAALWWQALRDRNPNSLVTGRMVTEAILKAAQTTGFAPGVRDIDRGAGLIKAPLLSR